MESYYYDQLDKEKKAVYHAMYTGLQAVQPSFDAPRLPAKELEDIYFLIRLDHPEIFYSEAFRWRAAPQGSNITVAPEYLFDKKKLLTQAEAMRARREKLVRPALDRSDEEKLLYVHDFICGNVRYDKLKKEYSHEIIGPLGQGVGVCEGIAKSVKLLCDALGVWCVTAISDNNPGRGIKYRHAWNIVRLGGQYYHIDATFDNSLGRPEEIRYDYFLLGDRQVFRDHEPILWPVPSCTDADRFYYRTKKLSFTKPEEVRRRAAQALKKGKTLIFQWRGGPPTGGMRPGAREGRCASPSTARRPCCGRLPRRAPAGRSLWKTPTRERNSPQGTGGRVSRFCLSLTLFLPGMICYNQLAC